MDDVVDVPSDNRKGVVKYPTTCPIDAGIDDTIVSTEGMSSTPATMPDPPDLTVMD
jgi:hypothetical protein